MVVTRKALQARLQAAGVTVSKSTLLDWATKGLIPRPVGPNQKLAMWTDWAFSEAMAAAHLLRRGWGQDRVMVQRSVLAPNLETGRNPAAAFQEGASQGVFRKERRDGFEWLIAVLKARMGIPLDEPATVIVHVGPGNKCMYSYQPAAHVTIHDGFGIDAVDRVQVRESQPGPPATAKER